MCPCSKGPWFYGLHYPFQQGEGGDPSSQHWRGHTWSALSASGYMRDMDELERVQQRATLKDWSISEERETLAQVAQGGGGASFLGAIQNLPVHSPGQLAKQGCWTR